MRTVTLCRRALVSRGLPLAVGVSLGIGHHTFTSHRRPLRYDAHHPPSNIVSSAPRKEVDSDDGFINPEILSQISGGSFSGFLTGLFVSVFSRTLVLLLGISIVTFQIAARYGIDLVQQFHLEERARSSRILSALRHKTPFKLSFGVTFALSAFAHF
ncbi:hypothetical protein RB594_002697 [Gaeumannomyces avenae]